MSEQAAQASTPRAEVVALGGLVEELLDEARKSSASRAAITVATGSSLRATVIALTSGAELGEHDSPPAATLQALTGEVTLRAGDQEWALRAGDLASIPPFRHKLVAGTDAVVLLTVALH